MGPILAIKLYFQRAFDITGRSSRSEFIWIVFCHSNAFMLVFFLAVYNGLVMDPDKGFFTALSTVLARIYVLLVLVSIIPSITLSIRRLHDLGYTGWLTALFFGLCFIPVVGAISAIICNLWLSFGKGTIGYNTYGQDPRHEFRDAHE